MNKIKINKYPQHDRMDLQIRTAASVEYDPDQYLHAYVEDPRSSEGRYVSSDLMKETFPEYAASNESRTRYNTPLHNSAAVLAAEQYSRVVSDTSHPERDQAVFLTGVSGAGKTTAIMNGGPFRNDERVIYEGQLSRSDTAIPKIQEAIDAGLVPTIVAIHTPPEVALDNTLKRFEIEGRGASIQAMARMQSELPEGLQKIHEHFGDRVNLVVIDRSNGLNNSIGLSGWEHLSKLQEGNYEQIRERLSSALEQKADENRISLSAYRQAAGLSPLDNGQSAHIEHGGRAEQLQGGGEVGRFHGEQAVTRTELSVQAQTTSLRAETGKSEQAIPTVQPANTDTSKDHSIAVDDGEYSLSVR